MADQAQFNKLFSSLTPLRRTARGKDGRNVTTPLFKLSIDGTEPLLELADDRQASNDMSAAEIRLLEEVTRLAELTDPYGVACLKQEGIWVSLWDNPYLLNLITEHVSIAGEEGEILTFSDDPAFLILRIEVDKETDEADVRLILAVGDEEYSDIVFLDDTDILCGDKVYKVKSVGDNYRNIRELIAPVEKSLLETFLTLLLKRLPEVLADFKLVGSEKLKDNLTELYSFFRFLNPNHGYIME